MKSNRPPRLITVTIDGKTIESTTLVTRTLLSRRSGTVRLRREGDLVSGIPFNGTKMPTMRRPDRHYETPPLKLSNSLLPFTQQQDSKINYQLLAQTQEKLTQFLGKNCYLVSKSDDLYHIRNVLKKSDEEEKYVSYLASIGISAKIEINNCFPHLPPLFVILNERFQETLKKLNLVTYTSPFQLQPR